MENNNKDRKKEKSKWRRENIKTPEMKQKETFGLKLHISFPRSTQTHRHRHILTLSFHTHFLCIQFIFSKFIFLHFP